MSVLRFNPLLGTWTMVAANRQNRPNLNTNTCPFCVGSGKVPDDYTVHIYQNDFPALSQNSPFELGFDENLADSNLYKTALAYGKCEVVLFSPEHDTSLWQLSVAHIRLLVDVWAERTEVLAADPKIQYVFAFENRGEAVGVTMHHPHGQIYAYPFVPLKLETELKNSKSYFQKTGKNLFSAIIEEERAFKKRVIFENDSFFVCIPFFSEYPFGVFIINKNSANFIPKLSHNEKDDLAQAIQYVTAAFEHLYPETRFPYMMCLHQAPCNAPEYADCADYFTFHIEFYPPWRALNTIKHNASSETGAWAAANTRAVEDTAAELRDALARFLAS
jgi:UDPglucose--hexose-1-phosphate uridylyltransferase